MLQWKLCNAKKMKLKEKKTIFKNICGNEHNLDKTFIEFLVFTVHISFFFKLDIGFNIYHINVHTKCVRFLKQMNSFKHFL